MHSQNFKKHVNLLLRTPNSNWWCKIFLKDQMDLLLRFYATALGKFLKKILRVTLMNSNGVETFLKSMLILKIPFQNCKFSNQILKIKFCSLLITKLEWYRIQVPIKSKSNSSLNVYLELKILKIFSQSFSRRNIVINVKLSRLEVCLNVQMSIIDFVSNVQ